MKHVLTTILQCQYADNINTNGTKTMQTQFAYLCNCEHPKVRIQTQTAD